VFVGGPIVNYADITTVNQALGVRLNTELVKRGFYATPDKGYVSLAHSDEDIDRYVDSVREILKKFKIDGLMG